MKRELIRVEPYSTNFEKWGAPVSVAARAGDTIYISGMPPFNPQTGEVENAHFEEQAERVMAQLKHALETAGSISATCSNVTSSARRPTTSSRSTTCTGATSKLETSQLVSSRSFRSGRVLSTSRSIAWPLPAINHSGNARGDESLDTSQALA